jgi:4-hydroxy-tetrahydrodipicolinate synthase
MDRRSFHKVMGLGLLGAGATGPAAAWETGPDGSGEAVGRRPGEDHKAWARTHFRGMENLFLPSFTPDFAQLDEDGIRADVRQAARQRFFSTMPVNLGLESRAERRRLLEIVADEARGKILVTAGVGGRSFDEQVEELRFVERAGASQVFMSLPRADTVTEIVTAARRLIDATDLPVVLYGQPAAAFAKFHPSELPLDAFDRLASVPNVVAVKFTQVMNLAAAYELAARVGDRLLIGPVHLEAVPLLASRHHVQWSGQWTVEALQSPERPDAVEFIDHIGRGRMKEALEKYWAIHPAYQAFYDLQGPPLRLGGHPWCHQKYYQWLTGGNGGLLRDLGESVERVPPLDAAGRGAIRETFKAAGIRTVDLPDEAFMVGNAAYQRGARARDLEITPQYVP